MIPPDTLVRLYRSYVREIPGVIRPTVWCGVAHATTDPASPGRPGQVEHWFLRKDATYGPPPASPYLMKTIGRATPEEAMAEARKLTEGGHAVQHHVGVTRVYRGTDVPTGDLYGRFFRTTPVESASARGLPFAQIDPGTVGIGDWRVNPELPDAEGLVGVAHRDPLDHITDAGRLLPDLRDGGLAFAPLTELAASAWAEYWLLDLDATGTDSATAHEARAVYRGKLDAIPSRFTSWTDHRFAAVHAAGFALPDLA